MSYILDALRKSGKERALINIPTLRSVVQAERKGVALNWLILASILATFIAVSFGLWLSRTPLQSVPVVQKELKENQPPSAVVKQERPVETQSQDGPIVSEEQVVELSDNIPIPLADLDPSIRNRLSELSINALSYSANQAKRFVMINQNIFREGEELGNGIVIKRIKKSTVVLSFEGNQFSLQPF